MVQTSWLSDSTTRFRFFVNADAALLSYLTTNAPNGLAAYITAAIGKMERNVLKFPEASKSQFPLVYLWTTAATDDYHAPTSPMAAFTSTFTVGGYHSSVQVEGEDGSELCGAIASAIQQTRDTTVNDWADFYCNWNIPECTIGPIEYQRTGDDAAMVRGTVTVSWNHDE